MGELAVGVLAASELTEGVLTEDLLTVGVLVEGALAVAQAPPGVRVDVLAQQVIPILDVTAVGQSPVVVAAISGKSDFICGFAICNIVIGSSRWLKRIRTVYIDYWCISMGFSN